MDDGGDSATGPELAPEAITYGTALPQVGQLGQFAGGQPAQGASTLPCRARTIHWLTAASLMPKAAPS
jgi:hypothetical protein